MSNAKKCDRCGKFYDPNEVTFKEDVSEFHLVRLKNCFERELDLCQNCQYELTNWMKKIQKENKFSVAIKCLQDNGITDNDDAVEVLQALCYILIDYELSKDDIF